MKATLFGTGYVGLVTGACLAEAGHSVLCMDADREKAEGLARGVVPVYEPGLDALVAGCLASGALSFTGDAESAVDFSDLILITVDTPAAGDGSADLRRVFDVAAGIGRHMKRPKMVVTKSTVPVGTSDRIKAAIRQRLARRGADLAVDVASNPEFLKEGSAVADFTRPDRIIVGTDSEELFAVLKKLYAPFNRRADRMLRMSARSAELTKYAANSMLATKISFINEMAGLAESLGADIEQVRQGIGSDSRIGRRFIYAGCGYGGSCFPKDLKALRHTARRCGHEMNILNAVEKTNDAQKNRLFGMLERYFDRDLAGKVVAVWGLAFKPDTDDMRGAPSRTLMEALWGAGARVRAYDPRAMPAARRLYPDPDRLFLAESRYQALEGADALAICTEWKQFQTPDFGRIKASLGNPVVFDGRNLYDPAQPAEAGVAYYGIGRGDSVAAPGAAGNDAAEDAEEDAG